MYEYHAIDIAYMNKYLLINSIQETYSIDKITNFNNKLLIDKHNIN